MSTAGRASQPVGIVRVPKASKVQPSYPLPGFRQSFTAPLLPPGGAVTAAKQGREKGAERYLTVREVADLLKVSTATIYDAVKRGGLAHVRVSNSIRIPASALP